MSVATSSPGVRGLGALVAVFARELSWIAPQVAREVHGWRTFAEAIPDPALRADALLSLDHERLNIEGAALFAVVPRRRDLGLVRLLVAYQIVLDYLDTLSERIGGHPPEPCQALHAALVEALDPALPVTDHYRLLPWATGDGGYLAALIAACRAGCDRLPGYARVQPLALRAATRFVVQVANHDPLRVRREASLLAWARREFPAGSAVPWFEEAAAASSTLGIHALLALAAQRVPEPREAEAVAAAYMPWICAASTLLDSLVDTDDDERTGAHNYLGYYADAEAAARRIREIVARSVAEALVLPRGRRHAVIACGMIAMYLSKSSVAAPERHATAEELLRAAGPLAQIERPLLAWLRRRHDVRGA